MASRAALGLLLLFLGGCGFTVGDPCTTASDCGNALCLQLVNTPGGYCSISCTSDSKACPYGSACLEGGAGGGQAACFRTCKSDADCRSGYRCLASVLQGSTQFCVGPAGF